jgi:predicted dehydrogenase
MAIDISPEQREIGKENFARTAEGLTRRGFMKSMVAGAAVVPVAAAVYFGYKSIAGNPVKAAIIGCGDEGGVLVGEHNPEYLQFIACCDIRPSNKKRIYDGDPKAIALRKGFKKHYGSNAEKDIKYYTDYQEMLKDKDIEAVVIALPLHLHAKVAIDCMNEGKHVLCEKLMAWNISQCKKMIDVAKKTKRILSIGHQRHYSLLYAHAAEVINSGVLGDIHHIRALWHRNNSWPYKKDEKGPDLVPGTEPFYRDGWFPQVLKEDADALKDKEKLAKYGFDSVEQLVRWRLYNETGGGLMAELGSHQLDACSIFLGKVHPLAVTGVGGKYFYRPGHNDRDSDDHVFVTFEFPGKNHPEGPNKGTDKDDIVVVTYSSVNTSGIEPYGETVMGTRGTMTVETEAELKLFAEKDPTQKTPGPAMSMKAGVSTTGAGAPAVDTSSTWGPATARPIGAAAGTGTTVSRGYREEMEDFAYCVREWDQGAGYQKNAEGKYVQRLPRCHGEVAMADAIIALTSNLAMKGREVTVPGSKKPLKVNRIEFDPAWFSLTEEETKTGKYNVPDGDTKPKVPVE